MALCQMLGQRPYLINSSDRGIPTAIQIAIWIKTIIMPQLNMIRLFPHPDEYATAAGGVAGGVAQPFCAEDVTKIATNIGLNTAE